MIITLSGLPGSGTTTIAKIVVSRFKLRLVSAGDTFRMMAAERNMTLSEFGKLAESDVEIDRAIDQRQAQIAKDEDDILVEGRLSGWMVKNADLKIWLKSPIEVRCKRIAKRDGIPLERAMRETKERGEGEARRYLKHYGININDLEPYDLIIDSSKWDGNGVAEIICSAIRLSTK
ncbi:MAG: AAA family ATPase [Methanocellales archaeon]|nr:AAA family ATPase [Methanocellales archaeon]